MEGSYVLFYFAKSTKSCTVTRFFQTFSPNEPIKCTEENSTYPEKQDLGKYQIINKDDNIANQALLVSNRGGMDWRGVQFEANKFIGETVYVQACGMSTGNDDELVLVGVQYSQGGEIKYDNIMEIAGSNNKFATGVGSYTFPDDVTNCYIYVQTSNDKNTAPNYYIDYIYMNIDVPGEPFDIFYRDPVSLGTSNQNKHTFENLPLWGLDNKGNKIEYSYYVVEDTTGKNYKSTTYSVDATNPVTEGTITITNTIEGVFGYELPNTGGIGTGFNYLTGFILISISGGFYIKRIRKRSVRDP